MTEHGKALKKALNSHVKSLGFDPATMSVPMHLKIHNMLPYRSIRNCGVYMQKHPFHYSMVLGWTILTFSHMKGGSCKYFTFEFHAVLKCPVTNILVDVTPDPEDLDHKLFLPDPRISYEDLCNIRIIPELANACPVMRSVGTCGECRKKIIREQQVRGNEVPRHLLLKIIESSTSQKVKELDQTMVIFHMPAVLEVLEELKGKTGNWFEH